MLNTPTMRFDQSRALTMTEPACDHLTGLPTRKHFAADFANLVSGAARRPTCLVLISLMEAEQYGRMLRALGHGFGEQFIEHSARLIASLLPDNEQLYHVSPLGFAVCLPCGTGQNARPPHTEIIAAAFEAPLNIADIPLKTTIGLGLCPDWMNVGAEECLRAGMAAAHDAREVGTGISFYSAASDDAHRRAYQILAALPLALAGNQLHLHFQPRIALESGACVAAEALVRWDHPELGVISPLEFIPLIEQTALIGTLTDWVIENALSSVVKLRSAGHDLRISVNVSPVSTAEAGFDRRLLRHCADRNLPASAIELEFTEGALLAHAKRTFSNLETLRAAGMAVAIDDFGSGYSNLAYLDQLPANVLKIDRTFMSSIRRPGGSDYLLRQMIDIGHTLGFRICAEGVETVNAYRYLQDLGCEEGQGFYMAAPMRFEHFTRWLQSVPSYG
ncbi:hypothetical protein GCM10007989_23710 [Devosia pacifica]|uniref:EAL domain-containing protein n=1 Tax=Devosia pacifica TaxID=1335967 RepID=A0A918VVM2_9HYPH|nr:bifunctional diguanylate cyclase/phosphodiesterase [Devosia pacifica]GHA27141.1 hypothetical protein GCM10007989_23710 [Devosia pacifica]